MRDPQQLIEIFYRGNKDIIKCKTEIIKRDRQVQQQIKNEKQTTTSKQKLLCGPQV